MYPFSILVNKENPLNPHYIPSDLIEPDIPFYAPGNDPRVSCSEKLPLPQKNCLNAPKKEEIHLWGISGYRSYKRQEELFSSANGRPGVAPPGCSEHQTGLALDISCPDENYELEESFAKTKEGWFGLPAIVLFLDSSCVILKTKKRLPVFHLSHGISAIPESGLLQALRLPE